MEQKFGFSKRLSKLEGQMKSSQDKAVQESIKQTIAASLAQLTPAEIRGRYLAALSVSPRPEIVQLARNNPQEMIRLYQNQLNGN